MITRRIVAIMLALFIAVGMTPLALAQQISGVLGGKATDEAKKPYDDYSVQLRNPQTGQVVAIQPLSAQGQFSFDKVELNQKMLVELLNQKQNKIVCTEGPFELSAAHTSKTDVNIECGKKPATAWLLAAAAGAASAVAIGTRSASK